jgi:hypothetical protein
MVPQGNCSAEQFSFFIALIPVYFYLIIFFQNCTRKIEHITGHSLEVMLRDRCTRAYGEAVTLFGSGVPHYLRDYFMEDCKYIGLLNAVTDIRLQYALAVF